MLSLLLLATGVQCSNQRQASSAEEGVAAPVMARPSDFNLLLGSGGGFTGRWDGYRIERDGTVWSWRGIGVPTDSTRLGVLPADSLAALARSIEAAGFYADSTHEPGNVTAFLEVSSGGQTNRVTWIPTVDELEPPKSPTEAVFRRARAMAAAVGSPD